MEAKLVVVGGKANKAEVKLKLPSVIGRGRDADLTVAHGTVSRRHCLLFELDGALVVRDNGSLNGIAVEGQRVSQAVLKPGDTLTVGPLTFRADYEHSGSFPSLDEQPTVPSVEETVGNIAVSNDTERNGAAIAAPHLDDPATISADRFSADNSAGFDFLRESADAEPEAEHAESEAEPQGVEGPEFEQGEVEAEAEHHDDLAGLDVSAAPPQHAEADAEASDGPGLDFLAEEVKPSTGAHAPTFSFLNSAPDESAEAATPEAEFESPDAEPIAAGDAPSFGILGKDAEHSAAAAEEEPALDFAESVAADEEEETERPHGAVDSMEEEPSMQQTAASIDETPATLDSESDDMAGLDFLHAEESADAVKDEAPSFGFLGALAPPAAPGEADSQPLEITLHDPEEEGEDVASVDPSYPMAGIDANELNFEDMPDDEAPHADAEPLAAADEDSGEFVLPIEPVAASDDDAGPSDLLDLTSGAAPDEEAAEAADEDSGEYAISLEATAPPLDDSPVAEEESAESEAGFNFLEDAPRAANSADESLDDDSLADESIDEDTVAGSPMASSSAEEAEQDEEAAAESSSGKKRGWWRFGKGKSSGPEKEKKNKENKKSKAPEKPVVQPQAVAPAGPQLNVDGAAKAAKPPVDADEAALDFLSDETPAPSVGAAAKPQPAKGKAAENIPQVNVGTEKAQAAGPEDDELNDFFESIGLD